jgi:hypothetical protein
MIGSIYRKLLWNQVKKSNITIKILDVGAAGDSAPLWKYGKNICEFITVDPFAPQGSVDIPFGLDSKKAERILFQTENPFCSSLYPPNLLYLEPKYSSLHLDQRKVTAEEGINTGAGDSYLNLFDNLDFIKIDTQGSEFSIIEGLQETIEKFKPIMYLETWLDEVYMGAPRTNEIINKLDAMGYEIIYTEVGASWSVDKTNLTKKGRRQSVGMDLLVMHKKTINSINNPMSMLSKIAILELYGMHSHVEKYLNILIRDGSLEAKKYKLKYHARLKLIPINWIANILDYFCGNRFSSNRIYPKLYD